MTIEDLGPTGSATAARGVNASALAAGYGSFDGVTMFGYSHGLAPLPVPLPTGATDLQAMGVNDAGVVAGKYTDAEGFTQPFRYDSVANALTSVPYLAGASNGSAVAINQGGVVAGFTSGGVNHGFRQAGALAAEDIGDLGGGLSSAAGINALNVVVGMSKDAANRFYAVRYDTSLHAMATLGGSFSSAAAINDSGIVVGYSTIGSQVVAARWTNDTTVSSLGTLGGATSQAWAVNLKGEVVGSSLTAAGELHAFLWKDGALTDLNDLLPAGSGWVLNAAYGINANDVIVGDGVLNGVQRGFRMTITWEDNADVTAPVIAWVRASPDTLWAPNNQMVPVTLTVNASDDSGVAPTCALVGLSSSDPRPGDMVMTGPMGAALRASKSSGRERLYTLTVQCSDGAGNVSTANATVRVPKNGK